MMRFLAVGLGNFPPEYRLTRHNIGFRIADAIAEESSALFRSARYGDIAQIKIKGKEIYILKPTTYMNASGQAVRYWLNAANITDENLLVLVDDIALPFGTLRIKPQGSHGGHNGLRDIEEKLGTRNYARLRFGVGNNFHAGQQMDYVLGEFDSEEEEQIPTRITVAVDMIKTFCLAGIENTMNMYNNK